MKQMTKNSILNYETVDLLREKVHYQKATLEDFAMIDDLLDAFGKPRNLILKQFRPYQIYSYQEYLIELKNPDRTGEELGTLIGTVMLFLDLMAEYFIKKENLYPEPWELKNPENV